jgi:hypothetical protein
VGRVGRPFGARRVSLPASPPPPPPPSLSQHTHTIGAVLTRRGCVCRSQGSQGGVLGRARQRRSETGSAPGPVEPLSITSTRNWRNAVTIMGSVGSGVCGARGRRGGRRERLGGSGGRREAVEDVGEPSRRTRMSKDWCIERECCLLVLNLVSSTLPCIRRPRPRLLSHTVVPHSAVMPFCGG